jgi:hypothetical protein
MAIPLTQFQEPGFFSQVRESPSLFLLPGTVNVVALIGKGKATKSILSEALTRQADSIDTEALANTVASITRVFSIAIFQYPTSSYGTSISGSAVQTGDVDGLTFKVKINDGAEQVFTFSGPTTTAAASAALINGTAVGFEAVDESGVLKVLSGTSTTGDGGAKIEITNGTANTLLFFTDNSFANEIDWTASIASSDNSIRPQDGEDYLVDYETPKVAADLKPKFFFNQSQLVLEYGEASSTNTLPLGAQAAFSNGASLVVARQIDPAATSSPAVVAEVKAALADLEREDADIIVPMVADTGIHADVLKHVSKMSSKLERKERMAILGLDETSGRIPVVGVTSWTSIMTTFSGASEASGLEAKRIIMMNPGRATTNIKGVATEVDGTYLAAGLAGLLVNPAFDAATPMTRKVMSEVTELIIPDLSRAEKNILTSIGVTVLEVVGALIRIRRAVTSKTTSIGSVEPSIVRAADQLASQMRVALENRFVGTKITASTRSEVSTAVLTFLQRFVDEELIGSFKPQSISVAPNANEPRQFDITFEYLPIFPFIWGSLDITITVA